MKRITIMLALLTFFTGVVNVDAAKIEQRFMGRLFRAVQSDGSLWYVSPKDGMRYSIRSETDSLNVVKNNHYIPTAREFISLQKTISAKASGRFILNDKNFIVYYANPVTRKLQKVGKAEESFKPLFKLAVGISDKDLNKIPTGQDMQAASQCIMCAGVCSPRCSSDSDFLCTDGGAICKKRGVVTVKEAPKNITPVNQAPSCNGTMCAGKCWSSCSTDQDFVCESSGASCKKRTPVQNPYEKIYGDLVYQGKSKEADQFLQANRQYFDPNFVSVMDKISRSIPRKSATECIDDFNKAVGGGPVMDAYTITSIIRNCNGGNSSSYSEQDAQLNEILRKQEEQNRKLEALKKDQEDRESRDRMDCLLSSKGTWYSGRCNY